MKKALFFALLVLIMQISCQEDKDSACYKLNPSGVEECEKLKAGEGYHCCLWESEYKGQTASSCSPVSNAQYDDIKNYISKLEDESDDEDAELSIDCRSNYITISILLIILLFL